MAATGPHITAFFQVKDALSTSKKMLFILMAPLCSAQLANSDLKCILSIFLVEFLIKICLNM